MQRPRFLRGSHCLHPHRLGHRVDLSAARAKHRAFESHNLLVVAVAVVKPSIFLWHMSRWLQYQEVAPRSKGRRTCVQRSRGQVPQGRRGHLLICAPLPPQGKAGITPFRAIEERLQEAYGPALKQGSHLVGRTAASDGPKAGGSPAARSTSEGASCKPVSLRLDLFL